MAYLRKDFPNLTFREIFRSDIRDEQRGLAHLLHERHKPILDKIRETRPDNPNRARYIKAAIAHLRKNGGNDSEIKELIKFLREELRKGKN